MDAAERVAATYLQAFFGLLIAGTFTINIGAVHAAAVAALPAGLSALKAVWATRVGDPSSAALLPALDVE